MLRSIIVGLDNSPFSQAAIDWGIQTAKRFDALLVGLGIVDLPNISRSEPIPLGGAAFKKERDEARLKDAERQVQGILEGFSKHCVAAQVSFKELQDQGSPAECISVLGQRYDLIVLGQESHFSFETQANPDNTLHDVLLQAPRPVVVVPQTYEPGHGVIIAYDGSLQSARAVQAFQSLELYRDQKVHVVCIQPHARDAAKIADHIVDFLRFHDIQAEPHPVGTTSRPQDALLDFVKQHNPSLLVMGAYGKMTWREMFFGTVTKTLLQHAPVPLFISH